VCALVVKSMHTHVLSLQGTVYPKFSKETCKDCRPDVISNT